MGIAGHGRQLTDLPRGRAGARAHAQPPGGDHHIRRTLGLDAASGALLWTFSPSSYSNLAGTAQITTATPVADPSGRYAYAASPDGFIHKLRVGDGSEVRSGAWPASVTRNPAHEKIASALNLDGRYVLVTTGGYIGDIPPYQGKVLSIDRPSGRVVHVVNSLCANRRQIIDPSSCSAQESAIWGRAGAVVDPNTHNLYATSSNGPFDGSANWADSVLRLSPGVGSCAHYTPSNQKQLEAGDGDLGSTSPALLPARTAAAPPATCSRAARTACCACCPPPELLRRERRRGGGTSGASCRRCPCPAATRRCSRRPRCCTAAASPRRSWPRGPGRLRTGWSVGACGSHGRTGRGHQPLLAGSLLWVYDPSGALNVYQPSNGHLVRRFAVPNGHWNSPIVVRGRAYLPTGNANSHDPYGV